jgi:hypothetical protein
VRKPRYICVFIKSAEKWRAKGHTHWNVCKSCLRRIESRLPVWIGDMKLDEFNVALDTYRAAYPKQRRGQAAFNVMHSMYPEIANNYRAGSMDPFHDDSLTDAFIAACLEDIGKLERAKK